MTAASVCLLAQLAVQLAGLHLESIGVYTAGTGAMDRLEKEVFRPGASWLAC